MKILKIIVIDVFVVIVFLWLEDNDCLKKWVLNIIEDELLIEMLEKVGFKFW